MKRYLLFFCVLFLLNANDVSAQTKNADDYKLKVQKFKKENVRGTTYWLIECTLVNRSVDTLHYLSMSCSWEDLFTIDRKQLQIDGSSCDKNFPIVSILPPGESSQEVLRIFCRRGFRCTSALPFKIGLNLIKSTSALNLESKLKTGSIIWSNEINLW